MWLQLSRQCPETDNNAKSGKELAMHRQCWAEILIYKKQTKPSNQQRSTTANQQGSSLPAEGRSERLSQFLYEPDVYVYRD